MRISKQPSLTEWNKIQNWDNHGFWRLKDRQYGDDPEEVFIVLDKRAIRVTVDFGEIIEMLIACYYTFDVLIPACLTHVYVCLELSNGVKASGNVGAQVNDLLGVIKAKKL